MGTTGGGHAGRRRGVARTQVLPHAACWEAERGKRGYNGVRGGQWLNGGWLGRWELMVDGIRFGLDPRTRRTPEGF